MGIEHCGDICFGWSSEDACCQCDLSFVAGRPIEPDLLSTARLWRAAKRYADMCRQGTPFAATILCAERKSVHLQLDSRVPTAKVMSQPKRWRVDPCGG